MNNIKSIILSLITLGLGYYFGRKQGKTEANADFMRRVAKNEKNPRFYKA
jgi:hypothetical protein